MLGPGVPGQVRLALNALPTAAQISGPPNRTRSRMAPEPESPEPVVVAPPEDPPEEPVVALPVPALVSAAAVAVPESKVAPTKAAITAERITKLVSLWSYGGAPVTPPPLKIAVYG